jgi:hypothetical protein
MDTAAKLDLFERTSHLHDLGVVEVENNTISLGISLGDDNFVDVEVSEDPADQTIRVWVTPKGMNRDHPEKLAELELAFLPTRQPWIALSEFIDMWIKLADPDGL